MRELDMDRLHDEFTRFLEAAERGEEVLIRRNGRPIAKLVPVDPKDLPKRKLGSLEGRMVIPDDFDDPLPEEVLALFESR